jgi:hypothetical protein
MVKRGMSHVIQESHETVTGMQDLVILYDWVGYRRILLSLDR